MHDVLTRSLVLLACTALAACGDGTRPSRIVPTAVGMPTGEPVTATIGSEGGSLVSADGALRVAVPPGAVAEPTTFSIQPITNHAHGGLGSAYRLGPEGAHFAEPVRLHFHYETAALAGTSAELLAIATQEADGLWSAPRGVTHDADLATVSVDATHFSDWSLITGAQISPASATVRTGRTVALRLVVCEREERDDLLAPLVASCQPSTLMADLVESWAVNAVVGGNAELGTVHTTGAEATYTAPAEVPAANPVAVSATYLGLLDQTRTTLVASVTVVPSGCSTEDPLEPCVFRLVEFDGQPLPYDGLARDAWENPEILTAGELVVDDFDGDGYGTWRVEWTYTEKRTASDLEHVVSIAGRFEPTQDGETRFVTLDGVAFLGSVSASAAALRSVPFYTMNTTENGQMRFAR